MYAYEQLQHFEYMAMRNLGPNFAEQRKKNGSETGVMLTTVTRIVDQVVRNREFRLQITDRDAQLAGPEHIHSLWIVHRDIKPEKLLCALDDSTIKIIDFDICKLLLMVNRAKTSRSRNAKSSSGLSTGQV